MLSVGEGGPLGDDRQFHCVDCAFSKSINVVIYDLDCAVKVGQKLFFRHQ